MAEQRRQHVRNLTADVGAILAHRSVSPHKASPPRVMSPSQLPGPPLPLPLEPNDKTSHHPQQQHEQEPGQQQVQFPEHAIPPFQRPLSPEFSGRMSHALLAGKSALAEAMKANDLCSQVAMRAPSPMATRPYLMSPRGAIPPQRPRTLPVPPGADQIWEEALANANAQVVANAQAEALGMPPVPMTMPSRSQPMDSARQQHHQHRQVNTDPALAPAPAPAARPAYVQQQPPQSSQPQATSTPTPTPHRLASSGVGIASPAGGFVNPPNGGNTFDADSPQLPSWARGDSQGRPGRSPPGPAPQGAWAESRAQSAQKRSPTGGVPRPPYAK